jgi:TolA-binding protein
LGRAYNDSGDFEKAKETFNEYLDKYAGKHPLLLERAALVGLAVSLRNLGDKLEAAQYYLEATEKSPSSEEKAYLLFDAARCFRDSGNIEKAREIYQQIKREYPYSMHQNNADRELLELSG